MSGRSAYQASPVRVSLALLVAYGLPVAVIGAVQTGVGEDPLPGPARLMDGATFGLIFGWIMAWPYLLGAFIVWLGLHAARRASPNWALATGLGCGLICGVTYYPGLQLLNTALMAVLGGLTGWLVWRIAYRRTSGATLAF